MMWRVGPDHEENDVTGKRRLSGRLEKDVDFSAIRELAGGILTSALGVPCRSIIVDDNIFLSSTKSATQIKRGDGFLKAAEEDLPHGLQRG